MAAINIVLAGLGVRGRYWAQVINESPRCAIAAYVDPNPAALAQAVESFGQKPCFSSTEEALAELSDVQALVLANPPEGRASQVRAATELGIPMLIEKPLALNIAEATQLVSIAEEANVPLMVGLNFRYLAATKRIKEILTAETVGQPEFARFTYERWRDGHLPRLNKYPLTMDQPMLWEQSIHHFDLLRYAYQQDPVTVQAITWNPSWSMYDSDANVAALFTFDGGMIVNYQGTWQSNWAEPQFEWRTDCTNGVIRQLHQFGDLHYARQSDPAMTSVELPPHQDWVTETTGLLDAFVNTIADDQPLQCSGRDHLISLAMVEACIKSQQEARVVGIKEVMV
ncbi:Gfo/Idh/MocA family protein [Chloroflexota bacterium]